MFKLYDAVASGTQIGSTITTSPTLANGLFSVNLDFGNVFNGNARWLDITVTNNGAMQTLSPRVAITPTPYALFALNNSTNSGGTGNGNIVATNLTLTGGGKAWNFSVNTNGQLVIGDEVAEILGAAALSFLLEAAFNEKITAVKDILFGGQLKTGDWSMYTPPPASQQPLYFSQGGTLLFEIPSAFDTYTQFRHAGFFGGMVDAFAFGLDNWRIANGTATIPGLGTINNALTFSSGGTTRMAIDPNTGDVWFNTDTGLLITATGDNGLDVPYIHVRKDMDVDGTLYANADLQGNNADLDNITARGNVTGTGIMYAQSFNTTSDRNLKEKFANIDSSEILHRVASLPITSWNFKTDGQTRHIGPMAQDFYAAFNVGTDDKHIATVDEGGVALAAIQGLNEKLKEKDVQIEALAKRLADLEQLVKSSAQK